MSTQEPPTPRAPVIHARITEDAAVWACPVCGEEHSEPLRDLVADSASAWGHTCHGVTYTVVYAYQRLPSLRRRLGIPAPVYPVHQGPYWRLPAAWKRADLIEHYHLTPADVGTLSRRAEQLAMGRGQRQIFACDVVAAWRELRETLAHD